MNAWGAYTGFQPANPLSPPLPSPTRTLKRCAYESYARSQRLVSAFGETREMKLEFLGRLIAETVLVRFLINRERERKWAHALAASEAAAEEGREEVGGEPGPQCSAALVPVRRSNSGSLASTATALSPSHHSIRLLRP